jgi:carbamoyl-phosphate synthase large subunit
MKILVTAIGGEISQSIIQVIRSEFAEAEIVGCDIASEPIASLKVDKYYLTLLASDPLYLSGILEICAKESVDLIIPVSEQEIAVFAKNNSTLPVKVLIANRSSIEIGFDKLTTSRFMLELGDFAPKTYPLFLGSPLRLPVIVKPRSGRGSQNVFRCEDMRDVYYYQESPEPIVFQEILEPSDMEITCGLYGDLEGRILSIQLHRKLSGGSTSWATVIKNEQITELCRMIGQKLDLVGAINVQLILTKDGPKVFEINPRYSSTVEMRHKLGFKDLVWGIEELLFGKPAVYNEPTIGTQVGRFYQVVVRKQD